jgi:carboxyl-terminal processing protease
VLVDGGTASAAEMLAGAIQSYGRGRVVGSPTYGKGCAQEYFDDAVHAGVLRLTTLLYALPDGAPVQGVGLQPAIRIERRLESKPAGEGLREREADVPNAPPTWRGPDVRDRTRVSSPTESAWPRARGTVGPCRDEEVCRALEGLGGLVDDGTG